MPMDAREIETLIKAKFPDADVEISKIRAKMEAGADFFQTQITYMPDALESFLVRLRDADLPSWPKLIIGVGPFKHLKMAIHMRDKVWGVEVPDELIQRMEQTSDEGEEGKLICIEIIERLTAMDGIAATTALPLPSAPGPRRATRSVRAADRS